MTFGPLSKVNHAYEPTNNTDNDIGFYKPSHDGVIKSIRLKYIATKNWSQDFAVYLKIVDENDSSVVIDTSNTLTLVNFIIPETLKHRIGIVRFDFGGKKQIIDGKRYKVILNYSASTYVTDDDNFFMFVIDGPFNTNIPIGSSDVFENATTDMQFYYERSYDDFTIR